MMAVLVGCVLLQAGRTPLDLADSSAGGHEAGSRDVWELLCFAITVCSHLGVALVTFGACLGSVLLFAGLLGHEHVVCTPAAHTSSIPRKRSFTALHPRHPNSPTFSWELPLTRAIHLPVHLGCNSSVALHGLGVN
jgi:hypothetical protein